MLGREGETAYEFFVIEEGTASVEVDGRHVADLGPDEWFGEIGLLAAERRTATVTAKTPMRLAVIFGPSFRDLTALTRCRRASRDRRVRAETGERLRRSAR